MSQRTYDKRKTAIITAALLLGSIISATVVYALFPLPIDLERPRAIAKKVILKDMTQSSLQWSADGSYLAVRSCSPARCELVVVSIAGRETQRQMVPRDLQALRWTGEGKVSVGANTPTPDFPGEVVNAPVGQDPPSDSWIHHQASDSHVAGPFGRNDQDTKVWAFSWIAHGSPQREAILRPRYQRFSGGCVRGMFSPDGRYLSITCAGWVAYEQEGPMELWVLDLLQGKLVFLAEGRVPWYQAIIVWDYSVQSEKHYWANQRMIVLGDEALGVEVIDVKSGGRRRLRTPGSAPSTEGRRPSVSVSPSAKWTLTFKGSHGELDLSARTFYRRATFHRSTRDYTFTWSWHPTQDILAWIEDGALVLWRIRPPQAGH